MYCAALNSAGVRTCTVLCNGGAERCRLIVDRLDKDRDGSVTTEKLKDCIRRVAERYFIVLYTVCVGYYSCIMLHNVFYSHTLQCSNHT